MQVNGQIEGHLKLPHSYSYGDCISLHARSNLHPNTKAGVKEAFNEACLRALVILLKKSASQVRLAESNFQRRDKGMQAVLDAVMTLSARSIPSLPHAIGHRRGSNRLWSEA